MKVNFFKFFWIIYLMEFVIPIILISHYLFGFTVLGLLVKTPYILYYLLVVIYHLNRKIKLKFNFISCLFIFIFFFSW